MKYLRLLRLPHQSIIFAVGLGFGAYFKVRNWWFFSWIVAACLISICAFMVNELVDRDDCDRYSWNGIHISSHDRYDWKIVFLMFAILTGGAFFIAYCDGLLWWAAAMYILSLLYSIKPVRLKTRPVLDSFAQMAGGFALPFMAIQSRYVGPNDWPILIAILCFIWALIFPYQLADYEADRKAKINGTHILLGMKKSLAFGVSSLIIAAGIFFSFRYFMIIPWANILIFLAGYALYSYWRWLRMAKIGDQITSLQQFARVVSIASLLLVPYMLIVWLFVK